LHFAHFAVLKEKYQPSDFPFASIEDLADYLIYMYYFDFK